MTAVLAEVKAGILENSYVIDTFTAGDCWVLAKALHDLTSLPIAVLTCEHDSTEWNHMSVSVDENRFMDIKGIHSVEDFRKDHACNNIHKCEQVVHIVDIERYAYLASLGSDPHYCYDQNGIMVTEDENGNVLSVNSIAQMVMGAFLGAAH